MQVVVLSSVFLVQFLCGYSRVLVNFNFLLSSEEPDFTPAQVVHHAHQVPTYLVDTNSSACPSICTCWAGSPALYYCPGSSAGAGSRAWQSAACYTWRSWWSPSSPTSPGSSDWQRSSQVWLRVYLYLWFISTAVKCSLGKGSAVPSYHCIDITSNVIFRRLRLSLIIYLLEIVGETVASLVLYLFTSQVIHSDWYPVTNLFSQTAAWLGFVISLPCLVSSSCFAPETPRFLLVKGDKTGCVDSLQWLRGHLSDLGGEFTRIEDSLLLAIGSRSSNYYQISKDQEITRREVLNCILWYLNENSMKALSKQLDILISLISWFLSEEDCSRLSGKGQCLAPPFSCVAFSSSPPPTVSTPSVSFSSRTSQQLKSTEFSCSSSARPRWAQQLLRSFSAGGLGLRCCSSWVSYVWSLDLCLKKDSCDRVCQ